MAKVTIDGKEYDTDKLPEETRRQLQNVAYCDRKLEDMKNEMALFQTARNSYALSLNKMLEDEK
ncbi:hypothetical protein JQT66_19270 [Sulfitobacter mediterraneus]|jgi:cell division protein ZapA (FtsZ GTPase activity inhibitor)|uniref:Uncharacterized protein n=1 Tax=Sulfitobacter mediterraneus TaxID=83219 RepID=A0A061SLA3_9RHOB|nr:DUF6447 family protein [Sulfitobacter mediterraneus]KAJ01637.1 hypothetical protein PM02_18190 [Sulfitobacter mediterraneus]MBM1312322.1 hypothetical protein [Sulfitobacter mediterraneus]MBM1316200.1 hypothetical protein [Sulfitobacter mediterraneus]MBM1324566.1 hypothetical protein [Sulfitobacter mediterraneus]MBM1328476.1 hypothetical protein [Sulfitobacter mediterraneus]